MSLLARRVQRHARLATLFPGQPGMDDEPRLLRAQVRPMPPAFPEGVVVQASLAAEMPDLVDSAVGAELPEQTGISTPEPGETRLPVLPRDRASAETDDPTWKRLEAISKAHREKAASPPSSSVPTSRPQERSTGQQPPAQRSASPAARPSPAVQRQPQARQGQVLPHPQAPIPARPAAPAPIPSRPQPESKPRTGSSGLSDDDWRRLEAISNAHRRKELGELAPQAPQGGQVAVQKATGDSAPVAAAQETLRPIPADAPTQAAARPVQPLQKLPAESLPIQSQPETAQPTTGEQLPARQPKPGVFQRIREFLGRTPATESPASSITTSVQAQDPVIMRQKPEDADRPKAPVLPSVTARLPEQQADSIETDPGNEEERDLPAAPETGVQTMKMQEKPALTEPDRGFNPESPIINGKLAAARVNDNPQKGEPDLDLFDPLVEEDETSSAEALPAQAQPLQAAWTVERQSQKQSEGPAPVPSDTASLESIHPQQAVVQRLLDQVQSGQPSDSKVETLPPRKPRPVIAPVPASAETAQKLEMSAPRPKTPEEPSAIMTEANLEAVPSDFPAPETFSASTAIDSPNTPAPEDDWEEMVETPAGTLPASLASLLQGQRPGAANPAVDDTTVQKRPAPGAQRVVQRSPESSPDRSEIPLPGIEPPADAVQRTVEISEVTVEPTGGQAGDQAVQPEVIEELARKVYAEVKRKMAVERERDRR